jgi:hypothetical protein
MVELKVDRNYLVSISVSGEQAVKTGGAEKEFG